MGYRRLAYAIVLRTVQDFTTEKTCKQWQKLKRDALEYSKTDEYKDLWEFSNAHLSQEIKDLLCCK